MDGERQRPVKEWVPGFRCTRPIIVNAPPACAPLSDEWDCAGKPFGSLVNQCLSAARANQDQTEKRLTETFNEVKVALASGANDAAKNIPHEATRKLAEWWVKETDDPTQKRLVRAALAADKYIDLADQIAVVLNSNKPPAERIESLVLLFNRSGHEVSRELTEIGIKGVVRANSVAIEQFSKSMMQFPAAHDATIARAHMDYKLAVARAKSGGADAINRANEQELRSDYLRKVDESVAAFEEKRRAFEEERARIVREHQQRLEAWRRQQAYEHAREQQRQYDEYMAWAQAQSAYMANYMAAMQAARRAGPSYGTMPSYSPPSRPLGGPVLQCGRGESCAVR